MNHCSCQVVGGKANDNPSSCVTIKALLVKRDRVPILTLVNVMSTIHYLLRDDLQACRCICPLGLSRLLLTCSIFLPTVSEPCTPNRQHPQMAKGLTTAHGRQRSRCEATRYSHPLVHPASLLPQKNTHLLPRPFPRLHPTPSSRPPTAAS